MRLDSESKRKMRDMGAGPLIDAIEAQDDAIVAGLTFQEMLQAAIDDAHSSWVTELVEKTIRKAKLRYPAADLRKLDIAEERKLDRQAIARLSNCTYVEQGRNLVIEGFTGAGKSYLACAFLKEACKRRMRAMYIRMPDLKEAWDSARKKQGAASRMLTRYGNFTVLAIDEWLLEKPDAEFRSFLLELMERRYDVNSTIFCTQYKRKDWHSRLGGGVHADAIMDRIVHNAEWLGAGEVNMREYYGSRDAS